MIISGMPGIGKTTSILCLARQLLGDAYKEAVLELNASDERGIDVVRNRIKGFAQKKVTLAPGRQKLVILDEADSMTSGAQQALRRTMEIYSATTRFAFACNQSNKIIEPLQSRCAILRYARLTDAQVVRRVMQICEAEDVKYSDDGIAALVFSAEGDMRQAINNLQSTFAGFGFVNGDNVFRVVDSPHPIKVQAMIKACHEQRIDDALASLKELWDLGYSCHDIISTMFKVTKTIDTLSEHAKLEFIKVIAVNSDEIQWLMGNRKLASPTCASLKACKHFYSYPAALRACARSTCSRNCSPSPRRRSKTTPLEHLQHLAWSLAFTCGQTWAYPNASWYTRYLRTSNCSPVSSPASMPCDFFRSLSPSLVVFYRRYCTHVRVLAYMLQDCNRTFSACLTQICSVSSICSFYLQASNYLGLHYYFTHT